MSNQISGLFHLLPQMFTQNLLLRLGPEASELIMTDSGQACKHTIQSLRDNHPNGSCHSADEDERPGKKKPSQSHIVGEREPFKVTLLREGNSRV